MKVVVAAFNQEKALVGAFSVIVQLHRLTDLRHYMKYKTSSCFLLLSTFAVLVATLVGVERGAECPDCPVDAGVQPAQAHHGEQAWGT